MAKDQKEKLETIEAELADQEETARADEELINNGQGDPERSEERSEISDDAKKRDQELYELKDQVLRVQAEFMNYKKRVERDRAELVQFANEKLIIELIAVLDNFYRALATEKEHDNFFEGMELIFQQLSKVLEDNGVEEFTADGEEFDPNLHHAVLMEESEELESGKVIETLQRGYKLNGKLVRPAMVKVAK